MVVRASVGGEALQGPCPGDIARPDPLLGGRFCAELGEGLAAVGEMIFRFPESFAELPFGGRLDVGVDVLAGGGPGGAVGGDGLAVALRRFRGLDRRCGCGRRWGRFGGRRGGAFTGAGARTCRARTFTAATFSLAAVISFGALQRSCVPAAGRSGTTSRRPISASKATAFTRPASSGTTAARMVSKWARTLPRRPGRSCRARSSSG